MVATAKTAARGRGWEEQLVRAVECRHPFRIAAAMAENERSLFTSALSQGAQARRGKTCLCSHRV